MADEEEIVDAEIVDDDELDNENPDGDYLEVEEDEPQKWPLYDAAIAYISAGWTPTPLRGKVPTQKRWVGLKLSRADCWTMWVESNHDGVGIVCGRISGNLVVADIEGTFMSDPTRMALVQRRADELGVRHLIDGAFLGASATTPSGGRHLFYEITDVEMPPGNEKLAFSGKGDDAVLLAETRGEGGQVAAPPGDGRQWVGPSGPGVTVKVTMAEFKAIREAFASVDEDDRDVVPPPPPSNWTPGDGREPTVADAWSQALMAGEITWGDVLDEGWTLSGHDDEGRSLWCRPDYGNKTKALSSAKGFERCQATPAPVIVVHSTSVPHLPHGGGQRITPARAWAYCFFDGDMAAATDALQRAVTTGEIDDRITRDIPPAVLARAKDIVATKSMGVTAPAWEPRTDLDALWDARDYLSHIREAARATRTAPDALLAVALTRTACELWPTVQLPAIVGGPGSLNLYSGLVAFSSGGKSSALSASDTLHNWRVDQKFLGSGEGLLTMFVELRREKDDDGQWQMKVVKHTSNVLAVVDEIDTLTSLSARQGATLMPALRTMWGGQAFGFGYRDPTKALHVKAHDYRLGIIVGIQPGKAGPLLDEGDAGTPQRFIWASTTDPSAPLVRPAHPGLMPWRVPSDVTQPRGGMTVTLDVCASAFDEIDQASTARLRGAPDAADGHRLYSQLKVAAILGILDGRAGVNDEDWQLSAIVMERSQLTRAHVESVLKQRSIDEGRSKAEAEARKVIHVEDRVTEAATVRAARVIGRHVHRHRPDGGCTRKCILPSLSGRQRNTVDLDAAIEVAVGMRWVDREGRTEETRGQDVVIDALVPGVEKP